MYIYGGKLYCRIQKRYYVKNAFKCEVCGAGV